MSKKGRMTMVSSAPFFARLALRYSNTNEAKPNNPIIEMIMIPNSELSMLTPK